MLTKNFRNMMLAAIGTGNGSAYQGMYKDRTNNTRTSGNSGMYDFTSNIFGRDLATKGKKKLSEVDAEGALLTCLALGTGTASESIDDIDLAVNPTLPSGENNPSTLVDDNLYTVNLATATYTGQNANPTMTYTVSITYNGSEELTITEIGWYLKMWAIANAPAALFAREVLDSPITVNNGDTFTVSMVIG